MSNAREVAAKVIAEVSRNGSYSNIASDAAIKAAGLSELDAGFASLLIYGALQRKTTLEYIIETYSSGGKSKLHPFVSAVLKIGIYQILYMDKVPTSAAVNESVNIIKKSKQRFAAGFVNAILRKIASVKATILNDISDAELNIRYSCPNEIIHSLINDYGKEAAELFLKESLCSPDTYARVNSVKICADKLFKSLEANGILCTENEPKGAFVTDNLSAALKSDQFKKGLFFIQDKASQTAINALDIKPQMSILDVCAAPGGKSFTAAMHLGDDGKIVSCDIYEKRVGLISSGAKRLGLKSIETTINDATTYNSELGSFDRVICDVPCSGLGVIRRKPEIKYRALSEYNSLPALQLQILETSARYLKAGGKIMYSTCTVRKSENECVVSEFLKKHSGFTKITEKTLMPQTDGTDGFYFSIMERTSCE